MNVIVFSCMFCVSAVRWAISGCGSKRSRAPAFVFGLLATVFMIVVDLTGAVTVPKHCCTWLFHELHLATCGMRRVHGILLFEKDDMSSC